MKRFRHEAAGTSTRYLSGPTSRRFAPTSSTATSIKNNLLKKHLDTLRGRTADLSVGQLQQIGRHISLCLRSTGNDDHHSDDDSVTEGAGEENQLRGLEAAALFTCICSNRTEKDQAVLLGVQDKLLAGLRSMFSPTSTTSFLAPARQRHIRAALLTLLAQPGFSKKKGGYRQHLVQALAEAAGGLVPPLLLLPILRAKETGPTASLITLEVLEKVVDDSGRGIYGGSSGSVGGTATVTEGVIALLHHVVAEVMISDNSDKDSGGKGSGSKRPPAHLMSFLAQACSTLPEYILLFAKDLLSLLKSRLSSARKLALSVLQLLVGHGGDCHGVQGSALVAVLHCAHSDGDATVRCAALDCVVGYLAREDVLFDHNDHHEHGEEDEPSSDNQRFTMEQKTLSTTDTTTMTCRAEAVQWSKERCLSSLSAEKEARGSQHNMEVEPFSRQPTLVGPSVGVIGQLNNIWATGGALLACLSTSAQALLTDDSKAVRSKALVCCLRILETYGRYISTSRDILSNDPCPTSGWTEQLAAVAKGAWAALENLAADGAVGGGTTTATSSLGSASGVAGAAKLCKTADAARDLLRFVPNVDIVDLLTCYLRCQGSRGAGAAVTTGALEAKRALRELVTERFCTSIDSFLHAVSAVTRAGRGGSGTDRSAASAQHVTFDVEDGDGWTPSADGGVTASLTKALCELLAEMGDFLITSLLTNALQMLPTDESGNLRGGDGAKATASVLSRTLVLLGEASIHLWDGGPNEAMEPKIDSNVDHHANNEEAADMSANPAVRLMAQYERLFWCRLKALIHKVSRTYCQGSGDLARQDDEGDLRVRGGVTTFQPPDSGRREEASIGRGSALADGDEGCRSGGDGHGGRGEWIDGDRHCDATVTAPCAATRATEDTSELAELLNIFRLLASQSLLSAESGAALEVLVFPMALSRRRLIRPAVGLALALDEPRRILLSSLAVLQDSAFARSSTDVGRACDYLRLIGVLAKENASFVASHVRAQYRMFISIAREAQAGDTGVDRSLGNQGRGGDQGGDDYMASVSSREEMEREIRQLQEASVTSDGMLSCYTPFLLAIAKSRVADARERSRSRVATVDRSQNGIVERVRDEERDASTAPGSPTTLESYPVALCLEALWALSEYAVLSPGLATAEVLPLAEELAGDALENPLVRKAAAGVFTRDGLATDAIATRACLLLEDSDARLRNFVLARLGHLMQESRIKTAHLSRFALLLADADERVRNTAQSVFVEHLQPRPDSVCRCLFETFFTLDAELEIRQKVLQALVLVGRRAAPGQGLGSLGGALARRAAETGDEGAAYFLNLVPPTNASLEAAEVALRRGQLAQIPAETAALIRDHFANGGKWDQRGRTAGAGSSASYDGKGCGRMLQERESVSLLPKGKALEMSARISAILDKMQRRRRSQQVSGRSKKQGFGAAVSAGGSTTEMNKVADTGVAMATVVSAVSSGGRCTSSGAPQPQRNKVGKAAAATGDDDDDDDDDDAYCRVEGGGVSDEDDSDDDSEGLIVQRNVRRRAHIKRQQKEGGGRERKGAKFSAKKNQEADSCRASKNRSEVRRAKNGQRAGKPARGLARNDYGGGGGGAVTRRGEDDGGSSSSSDNPSVEQTEVVTERPQSDKHGEAEDRAETRAGNEYENDWYEEGKNNRNGTRARTIESGCEHVDMVAGKTRNASAQVCGSRAITAAAGRLPWKPRDASSGRGAHDDPRRTRRSLRNGNNEVSARDARAARRKAEENGNRGSARRKTSTRIRRERSACGDSAVDIREKAEEDRDENAMGRAARCRNAHDKCDYAVDVGNETDFEMEIGTDNSEDVENHDEVDENEVETAVGENTATAKAISATCVEEETERSAMGNERVIHHPRGGRTLRSVEGGEGQEGEEEEVHEEPA